MRLSLILALAFIAEALTFNKLPRISTHGLLEQKHVAFAISPVNIGAASIAISFLTSFSPLIVPTWPVTVVHAQMEGITEVDGEVLKIFNKARQNEVDGFVDVAQQLYEEVVQTEPDFIYGWSNLGNVLTSTGVLDQAVLCYRKAISLHPPSRELAGILLNKASIELATDKYTDAMNDLEVAEKILGSIPSILTVKAVALSNSGDWVASTEIFEKVIQTAEKNALPWWLRYSMSLLECRRGTEAVAFLQRTISRFPDEAECKAFAAALYTSQGSPSEGAKYWSKLSPQEMAQYSDLKFVQTRLKWGPVALANLKTFLNSKYIGMKQSQENSELWLDPLSKFANQ